MVTHWTRLTQLARKRLHVAPSVSEFFRLCSYIVLRDNQFRLGALCLVDKTFHEVSLALPAVGYLVVDTNVDKQLDCCIADFLCNRIKCLGLTWTLL